MARSETRTARREPVLVDLALQGGGSHGAFTWGVVDRLLEEEWLEIEGISGTSAGAMNAAVLASGFAKGGAAGGAGGAGGLLEARLARRDLQPAPARAGGPHARELDARQLAGFLVMDAAGAA